jgi:hypothetical protein
MSIFRNIPEFQVEHSYFGLSPIMLTRSFTLGPKHAVEFVAFVVYFAGKFFPVLATYYNSTNNRKDMYGSLYRTYEFFYSTEQVSAHLENTEYFPQFLRNKKMVDDFFAYKFSGKSVAYMIENKVVNGLIFDSITARNAGEQISGEYVTCANREDNVLIANIAGFDKIQFYKVYDAYTAFQELEMYVNGVLTNNGNDMAVISDSSKLVKAGFDKITSFRHPIKLPKSIRKS